MQLLENVQTKGGFLQLHSARPLCPFVVNWWAISDSSLAKQGARARPSVDPTLVWSVQRDACTTYSNPQVQHIQPTVESSSRRRHHVQATIPIHKQRLRPSVSQLQWAVTQSVLPTCFHSDRIVPIGIHSCISNFWRFVVIKVSGWIVGRKLAITFSGLLASKSNRCTFNCILQQCLIFTTI